MATYAGIDLGIVEEWSSTLAPRERQINAYPGAEGLEVLDLGGRGGETTLRGVLGGSSVAALASAKQTFYGLHAGGAAAVFIDPEGVAWSGVILAMFKPIGPRVPDSATGWIYQRYELNLLHID